MTGFEFDPKKHLYLLDGKPIPGTTTVLSALGYYKGESYYTAGSRDRGNRAHELCELADRHCPDALTIDDVFDVLELGEGWVPSIPRLDSYLLFRRETGFRAEYQETPVCSRRLRVGGTFDKWGRYGDGRRVLVDLKNWLAQGVKPKRSAELQTALYALMAKESMGLETDLRVVLKLDGGRVYECKNPMDEQVGMYCCAVWWDRKNNGLIED